MALYDTGISRALEFGGLSRDTRIFLWAAGDAGIWLFDRAACLAVLVWRDGACVYRVSHAADADLLICVPDGVACEAVA